MSSRRASARSFRWWLAAIVACAGWRCGGETDGVTGSGRGSLFPIAVGNRWEYQVIGSKGAEPTKTQVVTGTAADSGREGYMLSTTQGAKLVTSIQYFDGDLLLRAFEETSKAGVFQERLRFAPAQLRVDTGTTRLGATYANQHVEEHLDETGDEVSPPVSKMHFFTVEAVDDAVTVPAGTFRAVRIRRDSETGPSKTYWYARGVGKVREIGGQTEDLLRVELVPEEKGDVP